LDVTAQAVLVPVVAVPVPEPVVVQNASAVPPPMAMMPTAATAMVSFFDGLRMRVPPEKLAIVA
jgi:hypothetical protein